MTDAKLKNVRKTFNNESIVAVDDINIHIEEGELIVLVGPSGCGKSTTLRCIAGLEKPDGGKVIFGDNDVTKLSPKDRDVSMVFQNYALYPSMTVYENMAFGLRMRGESNETIDEQVRWAADIMGIANLLGRYPRQLSGGQQQRVALGRAIVREPTLFLLDEPLSNLDAKLRSTMRTEIQELQRKLGVAAVFVTHDQQEAMTMGDRIAVMNNGHLEQIDTAKRIYSDPQSLFVADFVGDPSINFFEMQFEDDHVTGNGFGVDLPDQVAEELKAGLPGSDTILGIRPESMNVVEPGTGVFDVEIDVIEPLGDRQIVYFYLGDRHITAVMGTTERFDEGDTIEIDIEWPMTHFFDPKGPKVITWGQALEEETAQSSSRAIATDSYETEKRGADR
jgi:multiple sugar transport system ATP-binding protein